MQFDETFDKRQTRYCDESYNNDMLLKRTTTRDNLVFSGIESCFN